MSFISDFMGILAGNRKQVGSPDKAVQGASSIRQKGYGNQTDNAFGHMESNKYNFGSLVYPYTLEQDPGLGHYILFYAYRPKQSSYTKGAPPGRYKASAELENIGTSKQNAFNPNLYNADPFSNTTSLKKHLSYQKTSDAIALYMPADLKFQYNAKYRPSETAFAGQVAKGGFGAADAISADSSFANVLDTVGQYGGDALKTLVGERILRQGGATIGDLIGGGDTLAVVNLARGKALNPHLEAVFENVDFRNFNYTFRFTPRNEDEVKTVDAIIKTFKFHMLPERSLDTTGQYLIFPSEFEIHFMYQGSENTWLPFVSHCVLNSVDVDYGGPQFQTFRPMKKPGGDGSEAPPPTTIEMTLSFTESEIMTKEKIAQGY